MERRVKSEASGRVGLELTRVLPMKILSIVIKNFLCRLELIKSFGVYYCNDVLYVYYYYYPYSNRIKNTSANLKI